MSLVWSFQMRTLCPAIFAKHDSVRTDGTAVVEHHLRGCPECRRWSEAVAGLHRSLRVQPAEDEPDRTGAILAALPRRRPLADDRVQTLRIVTLAVALVQLVASIPLLFPSDTMPGMPGMDGHLERHLGISALAMTATPSRVPP